MTNISISQKKEFTTKSMSKNIIFSDNKDFGKRRKHKGYNHMPLKKKKEYIKGITGFKEITVCEDESEAYEYWKANFNHNPDDCCNLRK